MWGRRKMLGQDLARDWAPAAEREAGAQSGRTRVLLEEPDGADASAYWHLLTTAGYDVQWCPGPERHPGGRCPLVTSGHCELVERADVVVSSLGIDHESARQVVGAIGHLHPETPVIAQGTLRQLDRWAPMFEGKWFLRTPVTAPALLDSVKGVQAGRR